ncbi:MAG: metal-sulfur cluster assembly factor [Burkholderiales bacterium]|nr:metal-sulfur cluster assembly factor [Burkholderiales bacterium]
MDATATQRRSESRDPFPYAGPAALKPAIEAALRRVIDPELAMSIVDVGLVYGVDVAACQARVLVTMTSAACPVVDVIIDDIWHELSRVLPGTLAIDVELVWEPPWMPARMSDRAKAVMGW